MRLYNQAITSGAWASACRLLTRFGRTHAVSDGRAKAGSGNRGPSTCPAALELVVPDTGDYKRLGGARMVRVRPSPAGGRDQVVTQQFTENRLLDTLVRPRGRRWLLVVNPYSPYL
ncbi:MAG: hypothetical protein M3141_00155 [Actinomycetota bacterium]|nr:hypothetical protein [Actinomycetota bacterium]